MPHRFRRGFRGWQGNGKVSGVARFFIPPAGVLFVRETARGGPFLCTGGREQISDFSGPRTSRRPIVSEIIVL